MLLKPFISQLIMMIFELGPANESKISHIDLHL